jgi:hypothetical protein
MAMISAKCRVLCVTLCLLASAAWAGNPRFVTGTTYGVGGGVAMPFYTTQPMYYTDPADLNAAVTHAQADAMVAAAAAVWNVPTASLTVGQGGELAEHVSSANTYFNGTAVVFPADVQAGNYLSVPIAVVYDTDGSITDLLLGSGASDPSECPYAAVTQSVDAFDMVHGTIEHAVIVLNGRCVGSTPQQLLQMQYMLMRAFGRVLGLGWAQVNDNVFMGSPTPTASQMANWPIMHPVDIICGPYTYQCMVNPFTPRADDLDTLALLYPVITGGGGKVPTLQDSMILYGPLEFPGGEGMEQANITVYRETSQDHSMEPWQLVSNISGYKFQQNIGNPVGGPEPASQDIGSNDPSEEGQFGFADIPVTSGGSYLMLQAEAINPLYTQEYALGAYQRPVIAMSGQTTILNFGYAWLPGFILEETMTVPSAAGSCSSGNDGTEQSPAPADSSGWWSDQICNSGHTSWWSVAVKPNRTWTVEATALDASGAATLQKLQPVIGVWNASDMTGILPTVASQAAAMNSMTLGMTQLHVASSSSGRAVRIAVGDQFGAGRADFSYNGRILYADSISPATLPNAGGQITVTGMGFRLGNQVLINGVSATVLSWTSTQIVAQAPSATGVGAGTSAVSVTVWDASTGGTSTMQGVLVYGAPAETVTITGGPYYLAAGASASWNVPLSAAVNGAPAANTPVVWTMSSGLTGAASSGSTNSAGMVTFAVTANNIAGGSTNTLTGCAWTSVCATWTVYGVDASLWTLSVAGGAGQSVVSSATLGAVTLHVTDGAGHSVQGATVNLYQTDDAWEGPCPTQGACPAAPVLATSQTTAVSDANGLVTLQPLQQPGVPQVVNIAASAGTTGFTSLSLTVTP